MYASGSQTLYTRRSNGMETFKRTHIHNPQRFPVHKRWQQINIHLDLNSPNSPYRKVMAAIKSSVNLITRVLIVLPTFVNVK